jgi:Rps23 Pro-64 3,4-dihydroxylase Tpa1-like proline 4-hydroxylase
MMLRRSLREVKYVAAQMNEYDRLLEEIVYAFQDPGIVSRVERITGLRALEPDSLLYAGGVSMMAPGHYLNPHVDNSHDKTRSRYRVINLLYYVSPQWEAANGGNLELWPVGPVGQPETIVSRFNRLAVMVTHQRSWHSVSRITAAQDRCCVSNYYFSKFPVGDSEYFHVTTFRGRPEQPLRDFILRADGWARSRLRDLFPHGARATRHYYERD